jgi:hypothetical protein
MKNPHNHDYAVNLAIPGIQVVLRFDFEVHKCSTMEQFAKWLVEHFQSVKGRSFYNHNGWGEHSDHITVISMPADGFILTVRGRWVEYAQQMERRQAAQEAAEAAALKGGQRAYPAPTPPGHGSGKILVPKRRR